jgi:YbbR domain-containing protein
MEAFEMMDKLGKNWQLKLICLLVAIVLWFVVINEQNPTSESSYTVPVVVENLDSQYIATDVPKNVYIRLTGPRNTMVNVGANDIKAYVDLSAAEEGTMSVPIQVDLPAGIKITKQSIATANVRIDVYAVKEMKLTPQLEGTLDNDLSVESVKMVPEKVIVSGARRLVNQINRAEVAIPVGGKKNDFTIMSPVRLLKDDGSSIEGLEVTPSQSNVKVTVIRNAAMKKVPVNLITYGTISPKVRLKEVRLTPNIVEVRGSMDAINSLNHINLMPVSVDGLDTDKEWKVSVPPVDGIAVKPDMVTISIAVEKID